MPPPPFDELFRKAAQDRERLLRLVSTEARNVAGEPYLAWDELRYRRPPGDLTHEDWWLATKLGRRAILRPLPLQDVHGDPFQYALPDQVLSCIDEVTRHTSGTIGAAELVTSAANRDRYLISSLVEEAITSSQLEGASTSRKVAKEMLRTGRAPRDRSEQMILNNYRAMRRVGEMRDEQLTPALILELHRIVTDGTLDDPDAAGRLQRPGDERVAVWAEDGELLHRPPPAEVLPERLERLCAFANHELDTAYLPPVLRAITLHFMFGYDHYFEDGNGRTARAIFYWSMLRQGFWLAEFLTISKILKQAPGQYARSYLYSEQDENDLTYFYVYHLDVIMRAVKDLHEYLARKSAELRKLQSSLFASHRQFNHRQLALLQHALRDPTTHYTMSSHARSHGVTPETARQDLLDLVEKGLLTRQRISRTFYFIPVQELSVRLGADA
jgi:Fic family protein